MALAVLQLRLAIRRRGFGHGSALQRVWFVASWVLALLAGLAGACAVATVDDGSPAAEFTLVLGHTTVFLVWALGPLLTPGLSDETVDPEALEQFPLSSAQRVSGLLLGGLVTPTALFTLLTAGGLALADNQNIGVRLVSAAGAAGFVVLCVSASSGVQALLGSALTSRRGRDAVLILSGLLVIGFGALRVAGVTTAPASLSGMAGSPLSTVLSWLPPGAVPHLSAAARDTELTAALALAAVVVAGIAALLGLWALGLRRRLRGGSHGSRGSSRQGERRAGLALLPAPLNAAPATAATASAAQQLRYTFFRSPRAAQTTLVAVALAAFVGHTTVDQDLAVAAIVFGLLSPVSPASTMLAYDDEGFAYLLASGAPMRRVLAGKALAVLLFAESACLVYLIAECAIGGRWGHLLVAFVAGSSVIVAGIGIGAVASVLAPVNRERLGAGRITLLVGTAATFLAAAVVAILVVLWLSAARDLGLGDLAASGIGVAATSVLAWSLLRWAGERLDRDPWPVAAALSVAA